jgi:hypothetical protein
MTTPNKPALTPAEIDDLCLAYDTAAAAVQAAQEKLAGIKAPLMLAVQEQGYIPAHADKMKRLEGTIYVANVIHSSTVSTNATACTALELELSARKMPKLFPQLFEREVKYTLVKGAPDLLKLEIGGLGPDRISRIYSLFSSCFTVNAKTPSLSVDLAQVLREKEAEAAAKAERKAAKAAKKASAK